jgi:HK97 family phage major capsid protein
MPYTDAITSTDASALIPEEVASSIIQSVEITSAAMRLMRKARMSRAQQRLPVLSALPTAYFVASGGGLKQTSKAAWANKYLVAEEIAVIVPIPEAYLDDAEFDIWGEIKPKIAEAFAVAIDAPFCSGPTNRTLGDSTFIITPLPPGTPSFAARLAVKTLPATCRTLWHLSKTTGST